MVTKLQDLTLLRNWVKIIQSGESCCEATGWPGVCIQTVNISRLNDKERVNALNEVRFLASIRHRNIIGYKAAFIDESSQSLCIIMEFANDGDLLGKVQDQRKKGQLIPEAEI